MKKIILASGSPRRKKLLKQLGLEFVIDASNIDEKLNPRYRPRKQVESLSLQKATAIAQKYDDALIIAADTMVALNGEIFGKPKDYKDAVRTLKKLSGTVHSVVTGFTLMDTKTKKTVTKSTELQVTFKQLTPKEIAHYIEKEKPFDRAGSYAMESLGAVLIEKMEGDYFGGVGLSLSALRKELKKFGILII